MHGPHACMHAYMHASGAPASRGLSATGLQKKPGAQSRPSLPGHTVCSPGADQSWGSVFATAGTRPHPGQGPRYASRTKPLNNSATRSFISGLETWLCPRVTEWGSSRWADPGILSPPRTWLVPKETEASGRDSLLPTLPVAFVVEKKFYLPQTPGVPAAAPDSAWGIALGTGGGGSWAAAGVPPASWAGAAPTATPAHVEPG